MNEKILPLQLSIQFCCQGWNSPQCRQNHTNLYTTHLPSNRACHSRYFVCVLFSPFALLYFFRTEKIRLSTLCAFAKMCDTTHCVLLCVLLGATIIGFDKRTIIVRNFFCTSFDSHWNNSGANFQCCSMGFVSKIKMVSSRR